MSFFREKMLPVRVRSESTEGRGCACDDGVLEG
jgi:hypothetical protein